MWYWSVTGAVVLLAWVILGIRGVPGLVQSISLPHRLLQENHRKPLAASPARSPGESGPTDGPRTVVPRVSIIFAARNEANALPETLKSLQSQSWHNFEVIAVNDRSTDETPGILDAAAKNWTGLKALHITHLPSGWLGKNYALQTASKVATGDWILFTDADVFFARDAVAAAMDYAVATQTDHLALAPKLLARGFWLRAVVYLFLYNIVIVFQPQNAHLPKSKAFVGIGAFNLIRRSVYEQLGGHGSVAARPDEDLALGAIVKQSGFRQRFVGGTKILGVEWYPTLRDMARGLEKNALAPFQYQIWKFTLGVLALLLVYDGPVVGLLFAAGWSRLIFAFALVIEVSLFHLTRRYSGVSTWWALTLPVAAPILFVILVRSAVLCLARGGIYWRGTFYSLWELRNRREQDIKP